MTAMPRVSCVYVVEGESIKAKLGIM
ncbi:hypothetical protein E2C01_053524 [Portunus trituberculatus]|uniref:Uncharacterized protein n=1 Tax=Portunus trituberculatus TaxID=210409 RepID=A0A5B7GSB7_PORTR|nr:hypothetical protein [Portunus trituberculatus]